MRKKYEECTTCAYREDCADADRDDEVGYEYESKEV